MLQWSSRKATTLNSANLIFSITQTEQLPIDPLSPYRAVDKPQSSIPRNLNLRNSSTPHSRSWQGQRGSHLFFQYQTQVFRSRCSILDLVTEILFYSGQFTYIYDQYFLSWTLMSITKRIISVIDSNYLASSRFSSQNGRDYWISFICHYCGHFVRKNGN